MRDDTGRVDWILAEAAGGYDSRAAQDELHRLNRELEERIAERTELMRLMIESSAEAVVTIDRHGIIEEWNEAAERIFGWPRDQVIGGRLSEFIIPHRYRGAHEAGLKRFLATGQGTVLNRTIELSALNSVGEEFPIELSVWPVRCAEGYRFSAFLRDITERKRAMQAATELAERALRFRTVLFELARMDKTDYKESLLRILRTAAYTLGLGRMVFGRFEEREDDVVLRPEIIYRAKSDDTVPESELGGFGMSGYPQYYAAIISNRPVVANDAWTDPATVEFRDHYLAPRGITAMLDVPVWLDGRVVAVVCHEHMDRRGSRFCPVHRQFGGAHLGSGQPGPSGSGPSPGRGRSAESVGTGAGTQRTQIPLRVHDLPRIPHAPDRHSVLHRTAGSLWRAPRLG